MTVTSSNINTAERLGLPNGSSVGLGAPEWTALTNGSPAQQGQRSYGNGDGHGNGAAAARQAANGGVLL